MRRSTRLVAAVGLACSMFSPAALAAPPVFDRIPANAIAVVSTPSLSKLHKNAGAFIEAINAPIPLPEIGDILGQMGLEENKGFDPQSSIALTFLPPPAAAAPGAGDDAAAAPNPEEMVVIIVPTTSYADFVGNFTAKPGAAGGIDTGTMNGEDTYFKDLGGGFLAMAPFKGTLERADWKPGNAAAHNTALGESGQALLDSSDLSLVIFTQQAKQFMPQLEAALDEQMADNPAGDVVGGLKDSPMGQFITGPMLNDSTATITALRVSAQGMALDMAMAFKEGSETAQRLAGIKGSSNELLSHLPAQPYLMAMAMDFSSPEARKLVDDMTKQAGADAQPGIFGFITNWAKNSNGAALTMGMPPGGLMTGLFTQTVGYVKTSDPKAFVANMQEGLTKLNGTSMNGLSMSTSYTADGAEIEGAKVDTWAVKIELDENADEDPGQLAMAIPMVFGQAGGPGGYIAPVNGGLIQTFGRNQTLMNSALKVGKGTESFTSDKVFAKVSEQLPKNRFGELYIGVKSILEAALPLMAMADMEIDVDVPPSLPPIGMGVAGSNGGLQMGVYVPAPTMKTIAAVLMQVQAAQMGGDGMENDGGKKNDGQKGTGQPRF